MESHSNCAGTHAVQHIHKLPREDDELQCKSADGTKLVQVVKMKPEGDTAEHFTLLSDPVGNVKLISDGRVEEAEPPVLYVEHQRTAPVGRCLGRHEVQPPAQSKVCCESRGQL